MSDNWSDEGETPVEAPVLVRPARNATRAPVTTAPAAGRDNFPLVVGAVVGVLIVGLLAVLFLNNGTTTPPGSAAGQPANPGVIGTIALANAPGDSAATAAAAGPTAEPPPRMPLDEFKKLYDDPAKR